MWKSGAVRGSPSSSRANVSPVLDRGSLREVEVRPWGGALQNCSMEQGSRVVTAQQIHNGMSAGRLTEYGDRVWVAAECLDVLAHPLERRDLIVYPRDCLR